MVERLWRCVAAGSFLIIAASCHPDFVLNKYKKHDELFRAGLKEFERHKWDNAIAAFEKLTLELPARPPAPRHGFWPTHNARGD